jgi:putative alpha-1,2-mannosidase
MAYLFNYAGKPWRTQELVHQICTEFYPNNPDGLIGNEDCGQMSAWYIFSAMGFYPVSPGSGDYAIGTPQFDEVTIHLENGKRFVIKAKNRQQNNFRIFVIGKFFFYCKKIIFDCVISDLVFQNTLIEFIFFSIKKFFQF